MLSTLNEQFSLAPKKEGLSAFESCLGIEQTVVRCSNCKTDSVTSNPTGAAISLLIDGINTVDAAVAEYFRAEVCIVMVEGMCGYFPTSFIAIFAGVR
jgi:hypothetical protein